MLVTVLQCHWIMNGGKKNSACKTDPKFKHHFSREDILQCVSGGYMTSWAAPCNTGTVKRVSQFNMHSAHTSYIPRCGDLSVGPSQSQEREGERKQVGDNQSFKM